MRNPFLYIAHASALALAISVGVTAHAAKSEVKVQKDIVYTTPDNEPQKLDLFLPTKGSATPRPGVVFIHGGGWSGGDKSEFAQFATDLAARGYVAISINYRLSPKHRYPAAVNDVRAAIAWLRQRAKEYNVAPDRIASMGASAGGHLAAFVGLTDAPDPTGVSTRVNCVVDYFGRADLRIEQTPGTYADFREGFIGKTKQQAPELWADASPVTHVDAKAVPFLIVQGDRDKQVIPQHSIDLHAALDKAGVESTLVMLSGQGHGFTGGLAEQAWQFAQAFLDRHLVPNK